MNSTAGTSTVGAQPRIVNVDAGGSITPAACTAGAQPRTVNVPAGGAACRPTIGAQPRTLNVPAGGFTIPRPATAGAQPCTVSDDAGGLTSFCEPVMFGISNARDANTCAPTLTSSNMTVAAPAAVATLI